MTSFIKLTTGQRVRRIAGLHDVSLGEIASNLGISASAMSQKCNDAIPFKAEEIAKISDLLHTSSDVLLGRQPLEVA